MLYQLVKSLDSNRYPPVLVTNGPGILTEKVQNLGISTKVLPLPPLLDAFNKRILAYSLRKKIVALFELIRYNTAFMRLIKSENAHIVWCCNLRALLTVALAAKLSRLPLIWNSWSWERSRGWYRALNPLGLVLSSKIVTEYDRQKYDIFSVNLVRRYEKKFVTVYTGIRLGEFSYSGQGKRNELGLSDRDYVIGTVGVLVPTKGHIFFLKMAREIASKFDRVRFLIVGDIPDDTYRSYYAFLKNTVKQFGMEDNVSFLGWRDDVADILSCIDLFVSCSLREGLPGAVRQAMAISKPVVATDVGGTREVVQHNETGLIVPLPSNNVQALTQAVAYMIENPESAKAMGLKGRKRVERLFSASTYVKRYQCVFEELLRKPSRQAAQSYENGNTQHH